MPTNIFGLVKQYHCENGFSYSLLRNESKLSQETQAGLLGLLIKILRF